MSRFDTTVITLTDTEQRILSWSTAYLSQTTISRLNAHLGAGHSSLPDESPDETAAPYDPILCASYFAAVSIARRLHQQIPDYNFDGGDVTLTLHRGESAVLAQAVAAYLESDIYADAWQQVLAYRDSQPEPEKEMRAQRRAAHTLMSRLSDMH